MGDTPPARRVLAVLLAGLALAVAGCSTGADVAPPVTPGPSAPTGTGDPARGVLAPLPPEGSREGPRICGKTESVPVAGGRCEVQNDAFSLTRNGI